MVLFASYLRRILCKTRLIFALMALLSVSLPALTLWTSCSALAALGSCKWRRKSNSLFNSSTYGGKCSYIKLPLFFWVMLFKGGLAVKILR